MIHALSIGQRQFPVNLIQGPLAGISSPPFRRLIWQQSHPAFSYTEMISCKTLIHPSKILHQRFTSKDAQEGPVCFQLSGKNPKELSEAAIIATDYGADLIDLNCGCSVKKIRRKGTGSRLLDDLSHLYRLISSLRKSTNLPLLIKIRVGETEIFNRELAKVIGEAGADAVVVHGRYWYENYNTPCHLDEIQVLVETLKIPVIGNGDVADLASLKKMLSTGCSGVMIARASVGQPWLIRQLIAEMNHELFSTPTTPVVGELFIEHVAQLISFLGNESLAILQARNFAPHYARYLSNKETFCTKINTCDQFEKFKEICSDYFS